MQNATLKIEGMDGEACADKVTQLLAGASGVSEVSVSLRDGLASMRIDDTLTSPHLLTRSLALAGYEAYSQAPAAEPQKTAGGCCGGCCGG
jgi:copper chaperone CopZ